VQQILVILDQIVIGQRPNRRGARDAGDDVAALASKVGAADHVALAVDPTAAGVDVMIKVFANSRQKML
jgi:hypothetical protein